MTALARLLFPAPALRRSPGVIFAWWESRRPTYNLMVGGAGLITLGTIQVLSMLPPHVPMDVEWPLVVLYGVSANVCYSFGFLFESLLARLWGDEVMPVGPTLFRHGLIFSVGLTLFPIGVAWVGYLFTAAKWFLMR
jgi:hypothetical protein